MHGESWIDGEPADTRRRPALIAALALPWVVVAALILLRDPGAPQVTEAEQTAGTVGVPPVNGSTAGSAGGDPAIDTGGDPGTVTVPDTGLPTGTLPGGTDSSTPAPSDLPGLMLTEVRGAWRVEPGLEEAGALAVVVARAALTGVEPTLDLGVPTAPDGYAEHLVLESIERSGPLAAVATVIAVVLDGDPLHASVHRLAVPISLADGIRPGGDPWELPSPDLRRHDPELQAWGGPDDLRDAYDALAHAGIDVDEVIELRSTDGWPIVAEVRLPGGDETRRIWLRRHVDRLVVAGSTLAGAPPAGAGRQQGADHREGRE